MKERGGFVETLSQTGDITSKGNTSLIDEALTQFNAASTLSKEDIVKIFGRVRGQLPQDAALDDVLGMTAAASRLGSEMSEDQRNAAIDIMVQRRKLSGSMGSGGAAEAFESATAATFGTGDVKSISDMMGKVLGGATMAPGKEVELFDSLLALQKAAATSGVDNRVFNGILDAMSEAGKKTVKDGAGRDVLAAPTLAGMMGRDPVSAVDAMVRGDIPQDELEALMSPAALRGLGAARLSYRGMRERIARGADVFGPSVEYLGPAYDAKRSSKDVDVTMDKYQEDPALRMEGYIRRAEAEAYRNTKGGFLGDALALNARYNPLERADLWAYGEADRKKGGGGQGGGRPQDVRVTVRVEGPRDLDARVLQ